jgi:hypothetical protein
MSWIIAGISTFSVIILVALVVIIWRGKNQRKLLLSYHFERSGEWKKYSTKTLEEILVSKKVGRSEIYKRMKIWSKSGTKSAGNDDGYGSRDYEIKRFTTRLEELDQAIEDIEAVIRDRRASATPQSSN